MQTLKTFLEQPPAFEEAQQLIYESILEGGLESKYAMLLLRQYGQQWEDYILLLQGFTEPSAHLVAPYLAVFDNCLHQTDARWMQLLVLYGLKWNHSFPVKKTMLMHFLNSGLSQMCDDAFLPQLMEHFTNVQYYQTNTQAAFVSPFGEIVSDFVHRICDRFLSTVLDQATQWKHPVPITFVFQGMVMYCESVKPILTLEHLNKLKRLFRGNVQGIFGSKTSLDYIRHLCLKLLLLVDPQVGLDGLELGLELSDQPELLFQPLSHWIVQKDYHQQLESHLQSFFVTPKQSRALALFLVLGYSKDTLNHLHSLTDHWKRLGSPYLNKTVHHATLLLTRDLFAFDFKHHFDSDLLQQLASTLQVELIHSQSLESVELVSKALEHLLHHLSDRFRSEFGQKVFEQSFEMLNDPDLIVLFKHISLCEITAAYSRHQAQVDALFALRYPLTKEYLIQATGELDYVTFEALFQSKRYHLLEQLIQPHHIQLLVQCLETSTASTCLPISKALLSILDKQSVSTSILDDILSNVCLVLTEMWDVSTLFQDILSRLSQLAFHPQMLSQKQHLKQLDVCWKYYLEASQKRLGFLLSATQHLYQYLIQHPNHTMCFSIWIQDMILFNQKEENSADVLYSVLSSMHLRETFTAIYDDMKDTVQLDLHNRDYLVWVQAFDILARMPLDTPEGIQMVKLLLQAFEQKLLVARFPITLVRSSQAVHLVLDLVTEDQASEILDTLVQILSLDISAECFFVIEWLIVRLLHKFRFLLPEFLSLFSLDDRRTHFFSSLLYVALHLGKMLVDEDAPDQEIVPILESCQPWTMSHHYNPRTMAQYTIYSIHNCLKAKERTIERLKHLERSIKMIHSNKDLVKCRKKYDKYYLANGFHPKRDLNLEFLLNGMCIMLAMPPKTRIGSGAFLLLNPEPSRIPLGYDIRQTIRETCHAMSITQAINTIPELENIAPVNVPTAPVPALDQSIQRKIVPWETLLMQELDLFPTKTTQRHPIIIVATLLDKTANLGGLCRTCEIFKAESLVVNSLRVRDDPLFTSTSVTSSKWQPMEQVAEHELVDYLKQQKQKGYALLGLEQATNSKSLDRCEFPEKVCIVLGRETTGLPPHILDMLDLVIEIPQFGVVRSLNVHVSASLLLWEFVKQKFI